MNNPKNTERTQESQIPTQDVRDQISNTIEALDIPEPNASFIKWNNQRGFGFLRMDDGKSVFCHVSELCKHLQPMRDDAPDFNEQLHVGNVIKGEKGLSAKNVKCTYCVTPAIWELQPSGPVVFGVQEVKPVCTNKPNESSYKSTIKHHDIWEANKSFREAMEKDKKWKGKLNDKFFEEFGEAENIKVIDEHNIALNYPHGSKKVSIFQVYESKHFDVTHSGKWKEDEYSFVAEFIFKDIPDAKIWVNIVTNHYDNNPTLKKSFDSLTPKAQDEVLNRIKMKLLSPDDITEKQFNSFIEDIYDLDKIKELRQKILHLQAPGESFITSKTHVEQSEVMDGYGDETWGTGHFISKEYTSDYIVSGARTFTLVRQL